MSTSENGKIKTFLRTTCLSGGLALALLLALVAGYLLHSLIQPRAVDPALVDVIEDVEDEQDIVWTCSMHPQIQLPSEGLCPICFMDLIPLEPGADEVGLRRLSVTREAAALLDIETSTVERRPIARDVRMVGKIDYDETRLKYITAWVGGRLDRLYVDYTGVSVQEGDHMVLLYSPELIGAQEELFQGLRSVRQLEEDNRPGGDVVGQAVLRTLDASRERLRLLGLTTEQIEQIEARGEITDHITIYAPMGGIVVDKHLQEGAYVDTGTRIYTIADLSQVWIRLDAYESDIPWLRYGQEVEFTTEAHPGERFTGVISFIDPFLTDRTRTIKVRVNALNPGMKLKPNMFVRAVVPSRLDSIGLVIAPDLSGKWISPMHPEIIKDQPGECDICGMPLVPAETLDWIELPGQQEDPLVIPASAAMRTGTRAVVYLQINPSRFEMTSIMDWPALVGLLRAVSNAEDDKPGVDDLPRGPARRLWEVLDRDIRSELLALDDPTALDWQLSQRLLADLNRILEMRDFYDPDAWAGIELDDETRSLLRRGLANLSANRVIRLNRLLLEAGLEDQIAESFDRPTFEGREIVLGPRSGDHYIVRHGLAEGQRVVTRGQFKLDAELQIRVAPTMMSSQIGVMATDAPHDHDAPPEHVEPDVETPALARRHLEAVLRAALEVTRTADTEDLQKIRAAFEDLDEAIRAVPEEHFIADASDWWREYAMLLGNDAVEGADARTLTEARRVAELTGRHMEAMQTTFGLTVIDRPTVARIDPNFRRQLGSFVETYLALKHALAGDEPVEQASEHARSAKDALERIDMALLDGANHDFWMTQAEQMGNALRRMAEADAIEVARTAFEPLSDALIATLQRFGAPGDEPLYVAHCPMAFDDEGADWLQDQEQILNPYFGAMMLRCGDITEVIEPVEPGIDPQFHEQLGGFVDSYLAMQKALGNDEPVEKAREHARSATDALERVDMTLLRGENHDAWMAHTEEMGTALARIADAVTIEEARTAFEPLSDALIAAIRRLGAPGDALLYVAHCPMAFDDEGADWLQDQEQILNPYFGAMMLRCGEITEVFEPVQERSQP